MFRVILVLIGITFLVNSCSTADLLTQLGSTEWNVTSLLGKSLNAVDITKGLPSLNFSDNGKLFGSTGCNSFTGSYKLEGTKLSLDPGAMTKMMCSDNTEQDFLNAINQVTNLKMDGNTLNLLNGSKTVMSLEPQTK
jgi:heat shock protein HslJ